MATPKPDTKNVKKVKEYRKMGLSFREIARIMESDVRQVYRWANYELSK